MHARVSHYSVPADRFEEARESFEAAIINQEPGFIDAYILVDRPAGKIVTVTLWQDEASMQQTTTTANDIRAQAMRKAGGKVEEVHVYEVASQSSQLVR